MRCRLAGGVAAVVATRTIGRTGKSAVVSFGTTPGGVGFVAALTTSGGAQVATVFARCNGAVVAT